MFGEKIYAWKYGPVVKEGYKNGPIPTDEQVQAVHHPDDRQKNVIDEVLDIFGGYSPVRLMNTTHSHKPWKDAGDRVEAGEKDIEIAHETMAQYYHPLIAHDNGND